ncbi:hypothetical protein COLO4_10175 [Corchorus olitorius]|uniref:Uncharacterized protein n=1 Tax=Corchorus olitorius TaxID=93759 RepID=A0A1R3K9T2_9ROSI|nr:hypothetical protein COLO4_10175 [Corchorus olitorius]
MASAKHDAHNSHRYTEKGIETLPSRDDTHRKN